MESNLQLYFHLFQLTLDYIKTDLESNLQQTDLPNDSMRYYIKTDLESNLQHIVPVIRCHLYYIKTDLESNLQLRYFIIGGTG